MKDDPVLIVGMHRSGTSAIARVLQELGLFLGRQLDGHCESLFVQDINDWLLRQAGARWDAPDPFRALLRDEEIMELATDYVAGVFSSPRATRYWGLGDLVFGNRRRTVKAWGWKDPRTTVTLPVWRAVFPRCKVIVVSRHGVDVALSLRERERANRRLHVARYGKWRRLFTVVGKRSGFTHSVRCADLAACVQLWDEYNRFAIENTAGLGEDVLQVRFEDVMSNPVDSVRDLASFAGLAGTQRQWKDVAAKLARERAYSFRRTEQGRKLACEWRSLLARHGYGDAGG